MHFPIPPQMLQQLSQNDVEIYQKAIPLAPGTYRLQVIAKDVVGGKCRPSEERDYGASPGSGHALSASSLILADMMERVSHQEHRHAARSSSATTKVRPRMDYTFKHDGTARGSTSSFITLRPMRRPEAGRNRVTTSW